MNPIQKLGLDRCTKVAELHNEEVEGCDDIYTIAER